MEYNEISSLLAIQTQGVIKVLEETNQYTNKFGVVLSRDDIMELMAHRGETLKVNGRVELNQGILPKLIYEFCDSPYIYQDNYVEMLEGLEEIFYYYKNESLDELTDDELIQYMKLYFHGKCQGSLEFLQETFLEDLARTIRRGDMYD